MGADASNRPRNAILANLPEEEWRAIAPDLVRVQMTQRQVLQEVGEPLEALYFPDDGLVSLVTVLEDGLASEGAFVGPYGVVDVHALSPGSLAPGRAVVQIGGSAHRLAVEAARHHMATLPRFRDLLLTWANYAMAQALQTAACNTAHPIRARLARWLLEVADQLGCDEFPVTHEFLAEMLGVTRPSVTSIASGLQHEGTVRYRRGKFAIVDRAAFEAEACECYGTMRARFGALFGKPGGGG
jgi:CRP-like cAMP-binding protein